MNCISLEGLGVYIQVHDSYDSYGSWNIGLRVLQFVNCISLERLIMYIEVHDPYDLVSLTSPLPLLPETGRETMVFVSHGVRHTNIAYMHDHSSTIKMSCLQSHQNKKKFIKVWKFPWRTRFVLVFFLVRLICLQMLFSFPILHFLKFWFYIMIKAH